MTNYESISLWIAAVEAFAAVAVPVVLAAAGFIVSRRLSAIEFRHQAEHEALEQRLLQYEDLTRLANDFYCFSVFVGHYRELSPDGMIARKREFESIIYKTLPLWNQELLNAANKLLAACFITQRGKGKGSKLTADFARFLEERGDETCDGWGDYFLEPEERRKWIDNHFDSSADLPSYRREIIMPAYAEFLASASCTIGHNRETKDLLVMLRGTDLREA